MRQIGSFDIVTPPAVEPLTAAEAKAHCRAEYSGEDDLIDTYITAARRFVEKDCGLALINQTWRATFDGWDELGLRLRPFQVSAITAIDVWDGSAWAAQTVGDFQLVSKRPALLFPADSVTPATPQRTRAGIRITFTAGFGDAETDIPDDLRLAMKQLVAHWYENRTPTSIEQNLSVVGDTKWTVGTLLSNWRSLRLA